MDDSDSSKKANDGVGECPICGDEFPMAKLCVHASSCNGKTEPGTGQKSPITNGNWGPLALGYSQMFSFDFYELQKQLGHL